MNAHLLIHLFPIVFSLILLWTFAALTTYTAFATLLGEVQSILSEPILSFDCRVLFEELGNDRNGCGGHWGVFVHHELL